MTQISKQTVKMIAKILFPLTDYILPNSEYREIVAQLRHLAEHGEQLPTLPPKLITQAEAADMLAISLANFKKLEREKDFPFQRKMIGTSVRYRNTDILRYIYSEESDPPDIDVNLRY